MREKFKQKFEDNALRNNEWRHKGDSKKANACNDNLRRLYREAKLNGHEDMFYAYMRHGDDIFRCWGAIFSIKSWPEESLRVLKELAEKDSLTGLDARMALRLWEAGMLNMDI